MLTASGLTKSYGSLPILKGIDLVVNQGEVISIVGASGAGKTTLLQLLGTLEEPDSGTISIDGTNPFELSPKKLSEFRNTQIGFIFQFHQLLPEFTAIENACLPALIKGVSLNEAKKEAAKLLDMLGITARINHKPSELSGGEQQRVAVARSLINQPKVIFADEPSGNLDSKNSKDLHQLFFDLRKEFNQSFVIITHNDELANMADRKLVMQDGNFKTQLTFLMNKSELIDFLNCKAEQYNSPLFIESDPIQLPHRFTKKEDIEIVSFLVSTIAWGKQNKHYQKWRKNSFYYGKQST
jgi:lipoprotein-releasing system ATP-binding protein